MVKSKFIWLGVVVGLLALFVFGFLLPFLFSARSYEAVALGLFISAGIFTAIAFWANKILGKSQD